MLGLGYPGGAVIERLAQKGNPRYHLFPRPLSWSKDLNFSFSGLKTSLFYHLKTISESAKNTHLEDLASSFHVFFPPFSYLYGDNAGMIGVAGYFKACAGIFVDNIDYFDRIPRLSL